jgi:ATP-dependent RNA helicase DeaD
MAEELGEEFSPTDLAAAAFKLMLDQSLQETDDPLAAQEPDRWEDDRDGRSRGPRRRDFGPGQGMTRLYIDVGRDDNVRPADIVGAIANEAGIPGRAIGAIELFERFALVEVPSNQAEKVLRALRHTTIRGRKIAPSVARPRR